MSVITGLLDRIRGFREEEAEPEMRLEASARLPDSITTGAKKGAPPTFIPEMILEEIWLRDNLEHKAKVARQDPIAARIVYMVSRKALDDWFVIRTPDGEEHPDNAAIQIEFTKLRAKHYFTMALAGERWAGHTWLQVIKEGQPLTIDTQDSLQLPQRVAGLDFWTPDIAKVDTYDKTTGAPATIKIKYEVGVAKESTFTIEKTLNAKDMILFRTRPFDRSHEGRSVLDPIWDYLVYLRFMFHSVSWYGMKVGLGVWYAVVRKLTAEKRAALQTNLKDLSVKRVLLLDTDVEKFGFEGASGGAINFDVYIDAIWDMCAAGVDMPKVSLIGQEQGSIAGGEGIEKALYSTIKSIQREVEPYFREVVLRMNYDDSNMVWDWNAVFAHDEKQEAEIEVAHVSAQVARLQYMTMNEVRALDKMDTVEDGDASPAKKQDDIRIGVTGMEPPSKQEQTRNREGDQLG